MYGGKPGKTCLGVPWGRQQRTMSCPHREPSGQVNIASVRYVEKKKRKEDLPNKGANPKKEGSIEDDEPEMTVGDVNELVRALDKEEKEIY